MIMVGHIVVMVVMMMASEATQKRSMDKYLQKKKQRRLITLGFLFMSQRVMNELSSTPEIAHSPSFLFRLKKWLFNLWFCTICQPNNLRIGKKPSLKDEHIF